MDQKIPEEKNGIYFHYVTAESKYLKKMILDTISYVWVVTHYPVRYADCWWKGTTQISEHGKARHLLIRGMNFDIQFETKDFLECCDEFSNHGIELFQMRKPVPNSLDYHQLDILNTWIILRQNGVELGIEFPFLHDYGLIWSPIQENVTRLLEDEDILKLAIPRDKWPHFFEQEK